MTYAMKGLLLNLHAALADNGQFPGSNEIPVTEWYDLTHRGNNGLLEGFDFESGGWQGTNTLGDPFHLRFSGGQKVSFNTIEGLDNSNELAFDLWLRYGYREGLILDTGSVGSRQGVSFRCDMDGNLIAKVATKNFVAEYNFGALDSNKWYHLTVTYDSSSNRLWGFVNGSPHGYSFGEEVQDLGTSGPLEVGNGFLGRLALLRIYNSHLDFDDVSNNYYAGYLLNDGYRDLKSGGLILYREDISSSLNVSVGAFVRVNYDIGKVGFGDLISSVESKTPRDLGGTVNVNPTVSLSASYEIESIGFSSLGSSVIVFQRSDLSSFVNVNYNSKLAGRYGIEEYREIPSDDLESFIEVYNPSLPSELIVYPTSVGMTAHYLVDEVVFEDLYSEISVFKPNDLKSLLSVRSASFVRANYGISAIYVDDLESVVEVRPVSSLKSNLSINTKTSMTVRYGVVGIEFAELDSRITVPNTEDLASSIFVSVESLLRSRYDITPVYFSFLDSVLGVKEVEELEGQLFINPYGYIRGRYGVSAVYTESLESHLTIREVSDLTSQLAITPYGHARGRYELTERPKTTVRLFPEKDAYVREFYPRLNYGTDNQMYVGYTHSPYPERFRSYIGFDISSIPTEETTIGEAILRLYYDGRRGPNEIEILEPSGDWTETGITWAGQPEPDLDNYNGFRASVVVEGAAKYIEIDVTELVRAWHDGEKPNYGFLLKAVDEYLNERKGFYTKENIERRPELIVTYYDTRVYSVGFGLLLGQITARRSGESEIVGSIEVKEYKSQSDLEGNGFVFNPREIISNIGVSRPSLESSLAVRHDGQDLIDVHLTVRQRQDSVLESFITTNQIIRPGYIYVLYRDDIESSLTVRRWGHQDENNNGGDLLSTISITETNKPSSVYILYRYDLDSDLDVRRNGFEDVPSYFEVTRDFELPCSLTVTYPFDTESSISVRVEDYRDQPSKVFVLYREDLEGQGLIANPNLKGYVDVWHVSNLEGEVTSRQSDASYLEGSIHVPVGGWSELPSEVNIRLYLDVPSSLTVRSGNLKGTISIPRDAVSSLRSYLAKRVRGASHLPIYVHVLSGNLRSNLDVRVSEDYDMPSELNVRRDDDFSLEGSAYIIALGLDGLPSYVAVNKFRIRNLWSLIAVRVWGDHVQESFITVQQSDESDLVGQIAIRVWNEHDQQSFIIVRQSESSQLEGSASVFEHGNIEGSITARQSDHDDLNSIVSVYEHYELAGFITVRQSDSSSIDGLTTVRQTDQSDLDGYVRVFEHVDLSCTIVVRQFEESDLDSTIAVRVWGQHDQDSEILVRQTDYRDLISHIAARRSDKYDLEVTISITKHSNLEGTIEVITAYPYAYIM